MVNPSVKLEIEDRRNKKPIIVFTNGCFDLIHPGHLFLLKSARKLGDKLIVGLDSDRSVRLLNKRPKRPINDEQTRYEILRSFRWVDQVIIFDELLPLIKQIKPDILVKGGDYINKDKVVGKDFVESYGGKVVIVPYLEGKSTTKLINQIMSLR